MDPHAANSLYRGKPGEKQQYPEDSVLMNNNGKYSAIQYTIRK